MRTAAAVAAQLGLEIRYTGFPYRGFESLPFRQKCAGRNSRRYTASRAAAWKDTQSDGVTSPLGIKAPRDR